MSRPNVMSRLGSGEILLMDGATGSELHKRGIDVHEGTPEDRMTHGAWSATANITAPNVVQQVHEDYLRLGADVIISNNFWTNRVHLGFAGLGERWREYARAGAENAVIARDRVNTDAYVAAGFAPPERGDTALTFREVAETLAECGVDILLPEYVGDVQKSIEAVDACAGLGLPIWLGVRHPTEDGHLSSGETFHKLIEALQGRPVDAILPMCHPPERLSSALRNLRQVWSGPTGAYANVGYYSAKDAGSWETWEQDVRYGPEQYARFGREWIDLGAQIVGGCCGAAPEHIEALAKVTMDTRA